MVTTPHEPVPHKRPSHEAVPKVLRPASAVNEEQFIASMMRRSTQLAHTIREHMLDTTSTRRLPPISLPSRWFRLAWLLICVLQVVVLFNVLIFAIIYWRTSFPPAESIRVLYNLPRAPTLKAFSLVLVVVAVFYLINLKRMVVATRRAGRLAFWRARPAKSPDATSSGGWERLVAWLWIAYGSVFGRRGLFGIENRYFEQVLIVREGIEIVSQSYQSYRTSLFVSRPWLTVLSSVLLMANCWSTPLVHAVLRHDTSAQRVLCLAIDVALELVWAVVTPFLLVLPYVRAFDRDQMRFSDASAADNRFMLGWQMESQQVLASSVVDFVSKLVPLVSIFAACRGIGSMLEDQQRARTAPASTHATPPPPTTRAGGAMIKPTRVAVARMEHDQPAPSPDFWLEWGHFKMSRTEKLAHAFFAAWGVCVLAFLVQAHIVAAHGSSLLCPMHLQPWLAGRYSCALVEIDCYKIARELKHSQEGPDAATDAHIRAYLAYVHPEYVSFVVFAHCPNLVVPTEIRAYANLRGMEIYNSTLAAWPSAAAIDAEHHSACARIALVRARMAALPDGLLAGNLPSSLALINLVATNLSTLPDELESAWPHVRYLVLEQGDFTVVPPVLTRMNLSRLGLSGNGIAAVPDMPLATFEHLLLDKNPLRALPANIGDTSNIGWLTFDHTEVKALPAWVASLADRGDVEIYGHDTPYCTTSAASSRAIDCGKLNPHRGGMYPLSEETELRNAAMAALG